MEDAAFSFFVPGTMGKLFYSVKELISLDPNDEQKFLDQQTRELGSTFDPPPGLSPEDYSMLFSEHFLQSRNSSRMMLDSSKERLVMKSTVYQHGNQECFDELKRIESDKNFAGWSNPYFIEEIKMYHAK